MDYEQQNYWMLEGLEKLGNIKKILAKIANGNQILEIEQIYDLECDLQDLENALEILGGKKLSLMYVRICECEEDQDLDDEEEDGK